MPKILIHRLQTFEIKQKSKGTLFTNGYHCCLHTVAELQGKNKNYAFEILILSMSFYQQKRM